MSYKYNRINLNKNNQTTVYSISYSILISVNHLLFTASNIIYVNRLLFANQSDYHKMKPYSVLIWWCAVFSTDHVINNKDDTLKKIGQWLKKMNWEFRFNKVSYIYRVPESIYNDFLQIFKWVSSRFKVYIINLFRCIIPVEIPPLFHYYRWL